MKAWGGNVILFLTEPWEPEILLVEFRCAQQCGEDLQRDVDKIENWASTNDKKYNKNKCLILHLGRGNPGHTH